MNPNHLNKSSVINKGMFFFLFPKERMKLTDIVLITFFLSKNGKCHRYVVSYFTKKHLNEIIKSIYAHSSGLSKSKNELKWTNYFKGYDVEIIQPSDKSFFDLVYANHNEGMMNQNSVF